jgi:hypothetical protein
MTKIKNVTAAVPELQTEEEYRYELDHKRTVDLTRGDLLFLAEELYLANPLLAQDDFTDHMLDIEDRLKGNPELLGEAAMQEIYDEVRRNHEGEPPWD